MPYSFSRGSLVTNVRDSAFACAMSIRSNGSSECRGNAPAPIACRSVMANGKKGDAQRPFEIFGTSQFA